MAKMVSLVKSVWWLLVDVLFFWQVVRLKAQPDAVESC